MTGVEDTGEESERLLSQNHSSGTEGAVAEEVDDPFPELSHDEGKRYYLKVLCRPKTTTYHLRPPTVHDPTVLQIHGSNPSDQTCATAILLSTPSSD
jgi:hypothetical protein